MENNITDYRIIKGSPAIVEDLVKGMIRKNWYVKGDLIPFVSSEGTSIVLQNMVHYGTDL